MVGEARRLTFCLDHNFGPNMLAVLRLIRAEPQGRVTSLAELGIPGDMADEDWMIRLGRHGDFAALSRDGDILQAAVRRRAWRQAGITLLMLDKKWGALPLGELARRLIFWWPAMVAHAEAAQPGTAWTVDWRIPDPPAGGIRRVLPPEG